MFTLKIGDRVCVKRSVAEPRYAWGGETHHSVGKISEIENDGLLVIEIPNRPIPWQSDPSDMEKVEDFKVISNFSFILYLLKKYNGMAFFILLHICILLFLPCR